VDALRRRDVLGLLATAGCGEVDMAAVRVHHEVTDRKDVWCYCGASVVGGQNSDPAELSAAYTGSDGNGPSTDLADPQTYSRLSSLRSGSGLDGSITWRDMQPGTVHGAELTFAYNMRHTYGIAETAVMVYGVGGTGLENDWINGPTLGNCLTRFQSELLTIGSDYIMRGVILQIGAVDADENPDTANYQANLGTFIGDFRAIWPDISFIISRPSLLLEDEGFGQAAAVNAATNAYILTDSNSIAVNCDDVEFTGTGPHYLTPELETFGERYAYAASRMLYLPQKAQVVTFA
jgi:hypothetical protein